MSRRDFLDLVRTASLGALPIAATGSLAAAPSDPLPIRQSGAQSVATHLSIAALRSSGSSALAAWVLGYYRAGDGGAGTFLRDDADRVSADDGSTLIVDSAGTRWRLAGGSDTNVRQFGARGDGIHDDRAAIQSAIDFAARSTRSVYFPPGTYLLTSPLTVVGAMRMSGKSGFYDFTAQSAVLKASGSAIVARHPDAQSDQGLYIEGLSFLGGRNCVDLGKFHLLSVVDCAFVGWVGQAICLYNGEKLEFRNLLFYPTGGVADSCFSFCDRADSIHHLTGADEHAFVDRVSFENVFLAPVPDPQRNGVSHLIKCSGALAHASFVNVVAHHSIGPAFQIRQLLWSSVTNITVDGGGTAGAPQRATFLVLDNIEGCVFNALALSGGSFTRHAAFEAAASIWNTVFNGCEFGDADNVSSFGFRWSAVADGTATFVRCAGAFYSAMAASNLLRASLSASLLGCNFKPSNLAPIAAPDSSGNDVVLAALAADTAGAKSDGKVVVARIASGGGNATEPIYIRRDNVWLDRPLSFLGGLGEAHAQTIGTAPGVANPNGFVAAQPGSLFLAFEPARSQGRLYVKETGSGNTGWVAR